MGRGGGGDLKLSWNFCDFLFVSNNFAAYRDTLLLIHPFFVSNVNAIRDQKPPSNDDYLRKAGDRIDGKESRIVKEE